MNQNLIEGELINLGGKEYVVPPLSFKAIRVLQPKIALLATIGAVPSPEQMSAVIEIVQAALARNYPEITVDELEDILDMRNVRGVIEAVVGASGLVAKGEA